MICPQHRTIKLKYFQYYKITTPCQTWKIPKNPFFKNVWFVSPVFPFWNQTFPVATILNGRLKVATGRLKPHPVAWVPCRSQWFFLGQVDDTVDGSEILLTSWYGKYPIIYRVLYIPGGCLGFRPSTVPFLLSMKYWLFNTDSEIPIMRYDDKPYNKGEFKPLYDLNNRGFFHCSSEQWPSWGPVCYVVAVSRRMRF